MTVSTGGQAAVTVSGGPYALTGDSGDGPEWMGVATSPASRRSLTVSGDGGPLRIGP